MSKMKRVNIYVDEVEWDEMQRFLQRNAAMRGLKKPMSAGNYLMGLHRPRIEDVISPVTIKELKDGEPCGHRGCLQHFSHPCEVCGRIGGRAVKEPDPVQKAAADLRKIIKRPFAEHKKPKKNSKQASCPECRAPAGHRPTCSKGGA